MGEKEGQNEKQSDRNVPKVSVRVRSSKCCRTYKKNRILSSYSWYESLKLRKLSLKNIFHVIHGIKCVCTNCLLLMACTTSEASVCHSLISSSLFPKWQNCKQKRKDVK